MKTRQDIIDEAMDYMDFEKIHSVMKYLNWTWYDIGVPSVPEIRRHVRRLINDLFDRNLKQISTGGFTVSRDNEGVVTVEFILTSLEIYPDDEMV